MSDLYERKNPHRLYRDKDNAILAGVCAGVADYFGLNRKGLRLVAAVSTFFFLPFMVPAYIVLAIILPAKPQDLYQDESQEKFWRGMSMAPTDVFSNLNHRFRELELRLQKMEAYVTSREFSIDSELGKKSR
ncbi:MAG: envelope stress response membrane protein PspC [Xanthomonadales bacterium]|nr:envelope stress response membrane protein PspC [Gammaproteobacteria bacterium]MBT8073610.1 envelope stress response membrane protein PspC [Gammaproteobacteria bacterium]MBT8075585.1 envelope stress response membrane protein PspC [Gammaproteobacteria bacterium]NNK04452.1 envelope stress response membrane protein PspC [Xanthomonadales bacterium]NNK98723.1 envelope stress response membrane protein PspC [Xanthomonadales bacterium]